MSDRKLNEKLDEYQQSEMNLLYWDAKRRKQCREVGTKLFVIQHKIEKEKVTNKKYTKEEIANDIKEVMEEFIPIQIKYDYSKLPKKF